MDYLYTNKKVEMTIEEEATRMNDDIVDILIAYRKQLNKSMQDIADATGLTLTEIEMIESREHMAAVNILKRYAKSLGLKLRFDVGKDKPIYKRPLPVGITDFRKVASSYCYVDKTLLIKEVLDSRAAATLFTRPRRFGKTLNMDMLRVFFEKTNEDNSVYFKDKRIWKCGKEYRKHQGQYPVVFLTFKEVKYATWEENLRCIKVILGVEFNRHAELYESNKCNEYEKTYFSKVACGEADEVELAFALLFLTGMLEKHHGKPAIVLIDEYDTLIQQGYQGGYYDQAVTFMRNLLSAGLKDNHHVFMGFLTGILRVAKESIFSSLNNIEVNSILDSRYSEHFGFTPLEVRRLAEYYSVPEKYEEIYKWYDGYRFGDTDMFNPWSVMGYFQNHCKAQAYWVSTAKNDIIGEILANVSNEIKEELLGLLQGKTVLVHVDTSVIYPEVQSNPTAVFSFLLVSGYLKVVKKTLHGGYYMCELGIPNKELYSVYQKEILRKMRDVISISTVTKVQEAIYSNDGESLRQELRKLLLQTVSYNDAASENFYHGFVLGLCAMFDNQYYVTSNRESGEGRFDIQLMKRNKELPGIIIEIKAEQTGKEEKLKELAKEALEQIRTKEYETDMRMRGVQQINKYGVAFCGKRVEVVTE